MSIKMVLRINKVGMELELGTQFNFHLLQSIYGIPITPHRMPINWKKINGITIGIAREYYQKQIEFNIPWDDIGMDKIKEFLELFNFNPGFFQSEKLYVSNWGPSFVGTHFHFLLDNDGVQINKRLKYKKMLIFDYLLSEYITVFNKLFGGLQGKDAVDSKKLMILTFIELYRLVNNHNIMIYFDHKFFGGSLNAIKQRTTGLQYHYSNGIDKPKYQPILWSEASNGKPFSLEVRYIPNILGMNIDWAKRIIQEIQLVLNMKNKKGGDNIKSKIMNKRETLCVLLNNMEGYVYSNLCSPGSLNNSMNLLEYQYSRDYLSKLIN